MKKLGFTLAEVLITLAIVGIIAALTIPGLTRNVAQKSIGPTLAKAINNLNTVNKEALEVSGKTALHAIDNMEQNYAYILETYMGGTLINEGDATHFLSNDGILYMPEPIVDRRDLMIKQFTELNKEIEAEAETAGVSDAAVNEDLEALFGGLTAAQQEIIGTLDDKYYGWYWPVLIDINGQKGKNEAAKGYERFLVYVDAYGVVIPAGSEEASIYGMETAKTVKTCSLADDNIDEYCTATIIKKGWKLEY